MADITSPSRNSRTASRSSTAVGTSCRPGSSAEPSPATGRAGRHGNSTNRSCSVSQTRRPMAASSTDRVHAGAVSRRLHHADDPPGERAHDLPPAQRFADRPAVPPAASYASTSCSRLPKPPATSDEPKRHARTQNQPRSSSGSPRWTSSQSSTARSPSGSDDEVSGAEVTMHDALMLGRRLDDAPPTSADRARTPDAVRRARRGSGGTARAGQCVSRPGASDGRDAVDPGQRRAALLDDRGPAVDRRMLSEDAPRHGLSVDPAHDHPRCTEADLGAPTDHLRPRRPRPPRTPAARAARSRLCLRSPSLRRSERCPGDPAGR